MLFTVEHLARRSRIMVCGAGLILLGCSQSALTTPQTVALTEAEDRWKRSAICDYSFEIHPFAPLSFGQNSGQIVKITAFKDLTGQ
jgi:hypothetical protein